MTTPLENTEFDMERMRQVLEENNRALREEVIRSMRILSAEERKSIIDEAVDSAVCKVVDMTNRGEIGSGGFEVPTGPQSQSHSATHLSPAKS